jgi:hypothetical protein
MEKIEVEVICLKPLEAFVQLRWHVFWVIEWRVSSLTNDDDIVSKSAVVDPMTQEA